MYFWDKHKTVTSYYEVLSGEVCDRYGLTQMEYDILMFLHNNPQHNTAAEIVKIRKSTKSHVSTSLKKLEEKGLVERIQSEDNKKHIEIVLLDQAEEIVEAGINAQKQFAKNVLCGMTEEEIHRYFEDDLRRLATAQDMTYEETCTRLKEANEGYHFRQNSEGIYNPFRVLNSYEKMVFGC